MKNLTTYESFLNEAENEKIAVKSIKLSPNNDMSDAKTFSSFKDANNHFWSKVKNFSDLCYEIEWQDGYEINGSIDLEPRSFWRVDSKEPVNREMKDILKGENPIGWHLATFNSNVAVSDSGAISAEQKDNAKKLIDKYSLTD